MSPSARKPLGAIVGVSVAVITAVLVVAAGKTVVGGQSPVPTNSPGIEPVPSISDEDQARIQATLAAILEDALQNPANRRLTPTPTPFGLTPTPISIRIGASNVMLPPDMEYGEVLWSNQPNASRRTAYGFFYSDEAGISRLYVDRETGETLHGGGILPQHAPLFAEVLAALSSDVRPVLDSPTPGPRPVADP